MKTLARPVKSAAVSLLAAVALFGTAAASPIAPQASANPVGNCGGSVQTYRQNGPIDAWRVRVTGVDLMGIIRPAVRGEFNMSISGPDGESFLARSIPFDEFTGPSDSVIVRGPEVRVSVQVVATPANGRSCSYYYVAPYPGA
jgi:hypothetical protein